MLPAVIFSHYSRPFLTVAGTYGGQNTHKNAIPDTAVRGDLPRLVPRYR